MRTFCVNPANRLTWHQDGEERGIEYELWAQQQNGRTSTAVSHPELTRTGTIAAAIYHSLRNGIKKTTGPITTVCGPGVQQKAGQINAYLTSSETVTKRTAPSQITSSLQTGRTTISYRRRMICPSLERQEQNTTVRPQIFFACRLGGGERHNSLLIERTTKLQQRNDSLSNSIHWESNRDITEENMSLRFALSTENGENAKM